jgi:hypothetical protein
MMSSRAADRAPTLLPHLAADAARSMLLGIKRGAEKAAGSAPLSGGRVGKGAAVG